MIDLVTEQLVASSVFSSRSNHARALLLCIYMAASKVRGRWVGLRSGD